MIDTELANETFVRNYLRSMYMSVVLFSSDFFLGSQVECNGTENIYVCRAKNNPRLKKTNVARRNLSKMHFVVENTSLCVIFAVGYFSIYNFSISYVIYIWYIFLRVIFSDGIFSNRLYFPYFHRY